MIGGLDVAAPPIPGLHFRRYRETAEQAEMPRVHQAPAKTFTVWRKPL